jgi:hypothetical protein
LTSSTATLFVLFCRCHRDRARFDQVWVSATGLFFRLSFLVDADPVS